MKGPVAAVLPALLLWARCFAAEPGDGGSSPPGKLYPGEMVVKVPEPVRKDLCERAVRFGLRVYPDVDQKDLRAKCEDCFLREEYVLRHTTSCPEVGFRGKPGISTDFPDARTITLWTEVPPPGAGPLDRKEPLTLAEAAPLAEAVATRLVDKDYLARKMRLTSKGECQPDETYYFYWEALPAEAVGGSGRMIKVHVTKRTGAVKCAELRNELEKPTWPLDRVAAAGKEQLRDFKVENLRLFAMGINGRRILTWAHVLPAPPMGVPRDLTEWDATTGELLYSEVLKGGTHEKPYQSERLLQMRGETSEENRRRNIEALIEERLRQLATAAEKLKE